jgi:predicted transcriptional regulator
MAVLWELGSSSVREIHERVGEDDGLVYTTTAKIVDRLHAKRLVTRQRVGLAFVYRPAIRRATVDRFRVRAVLDRMLGTEPRPAIATLVDAIATIDPDLLDDLAREIRRRRRRGS